MKRYTIIFSLIIFISLILWATVPAQQQLQMQSKNNVRAQTKIIDSLNLRIKKMEKELAELRKVIKIKGGNVEIKSQGSLTLSGSTLSMSSQTKMDLKGMTLNLNATTMTLKGDNNLDLKSALIKLN